VADKARTLAEGIDLAGNALASGAALRTLERLVEVSNRAS
jgi:anthranilate phosphoribosyltransferase